MILEFYPGKKNKNKIVCALQLIPPAAHSRKFIYE